MDRSQAGRRKQYTLLASACSVDRMYSTKANETY
jgi:hypothetical protein